MPSKNKPLTETQLAAYESKRDLAAELLRSVREMQAGKVHVVSPPVNAGHHCGEMTTSLRLHCGIRSDTIGLMNTFLRSDEFDAWLAALKDKIGRARIALRIRSAEHGNFGDCEPVGEGVSEMRIHFGPGYRVYFTRRGEVLYLLLLGGDNASQKRDIKRAIEMARALNKE